MNKIVAPCPFCKDTLPLEIERCYCDCGQHQWVYVSCQKCGATGPRAIQHIDASAEEMNEAECRAIQCWDAWLKNGTDLMVIGGERNENNKK